jgi:hypothetical protein
MEPEDEQGDNSDIWRLFRKNRATESHSKPQKNRMDI